MLSAWIKEIGTLLMHLHIIDFRIQILHLYAIAPIVLCQGPIQYKDVVLPV